MTLTMLDTNIVSDVIRNPVGRIAARLLSRGDADLCVSIITACELHFGAAKIASPRMKARVEGALDTVEVVDFKSPAHLTYAAIRAELTASDNIIGPLDLLIAAHARTLGAILVTPMQPNSPASRACTSKTGLPDRPPCTPRRK